jgi:hypothetical protein
VLSSQIAAFFCQHGARVPHLDCLRDLRQRLPGNPVRGPDRLLWDNALAEEIIRLRFCRNALPGSGGGGSPGPRHSAPRQIDLIRALQLMNPKPSWSSISAASRAVVAHCGARAGPRMHTEHAVLKCAVGDRRSRGCGLDGLYDGGHGADQLPESLDWPGFAGDVDAGL